jgi:hypothetical protein
MAEPIIAALPVENIVLADDAESSVAPIRPDGGVT